MAALMMKARTLIFLLVFIVLQISKNNTTGHTITNYFDPVMKSLRIRRGRRLLANDNPASTRNRRRIVGVFIIGLCAVTTV